MLTIAKPVITPRGRVNLLAVLVLLCGAFQSAEAQFVIRVQPIQVARDDGSSPAPFTLPGDALPYLEEYSDKIWAQAGIDISFLPLRSFNSTLFLDVVDTLAVPNSASKLFGLPGHGQYTEDDHVINLWFVNSIGGSGSYSGLARIGDNGVAIAAATFSLSLADVVAHEIGHNLGLDHATYGAGGSLNLMTAGGSRSSPSLPSQIYDPITNPGGTDFLNAAQITKSLDSYFVTAAVPEPLAGAILVAGALAGWSLSRRFRRG